MNNSTQTSANSILVWIALILSVIAIILAWSAYNRAGVDLEQQIERGAEEAVLEVDQGLDEAERGARDFGADTLEETSEQLDEGAADLRTDDE